MTVFFIFTPILIFLSWILTICVDGPSKDFAYELDIQLRIDRGKPKTEEQKRENYFSGWEFTKRSWKIIGFVIWLILVLATTEIYQAVRGPRQPSTINDATPNMMVTNQNRTKLAR